MASTSGANPPSPDGHDEDLVPVKLPSGAVFWVYGREKKYFDDRVERYLTDNLFCVPPGTLISTPFGPVPVEHLPSEGWAFDEATQKVEAAHLTVRPTAPQRVVTISTGSRRLRCSPNHPVLVAQTFRSKRVGRRGQPRLASKLEWVEASDVKAGDVLVVQDELPDVGGDLAPTRHITEGFAAFCGLFIGDGLVVAGRYVRICRGERATHMDHYRQVMEREFVKASGVPVVVAERSGYSEFASTVAVRELEVLGLTGGSYGKRVPRWVFGLSAKLRAAFLRGYLDSDGCVDRNGRMAFASPNGELIEGVRHLAMGLGLPVSNVSVGERVTRLPQGGERTLVVHSFICTNAATCAAIVGSHDTRYLERWNDELPAVPDGGMTIGKRTRIAPPRNTIFSKVRTVTTSEHVETMYDVTCPDFHTFIADGVVTHNTNVADLQDLDRIIVLELFSWRWGTWMSQQQDYWNDPVDENQLARQLKDADAQLKNLKSGLGIDKVTRDKVKGEDSVSSYLENLKIRAREFGVMREAQLGVALELFNDLIGRVTLYDNTTEDERRELKCDLADIHRWLTEEAFPKFQEVDERFRNNQQKFYIREM
jgi:hypothetical protein